MKNFFWLKFDAKIWRKFGAKIWRKFVDKFCAKFSKFYAKFGVKFKQKFNKILKALNLSVNLAKFCVKFKQKFKILKALNLSVNLAKFCVKFKQKFKNLKALNLSVNLAKFGVIFVAIFFTNCGYMPTGKVADKVFGENIYVRAEISQQDSRNSIYIVDTIRELIINKLGKSPSTREEADDTIEVKMQNLSFIPIIYDENGYVIAYKARIILAFKVDFKDGQTQKMTTSGDYDFAISPNSVISDNVRFEAIRSASSEAFDEFVSLISIRAHQKNLGVLEQNNSF